MTAFAPRSSLATHEVANQPPDLAEVNLYLGDPALRAAATREAGDWVEAPLAALGRDAGSAAVLDLGAEANRYPPELASFDRRGRRLDEVRFHPAYHQLLDLAMRHRIAAIAWDAPRPGGHIAHAALLALFSQAEQGTMCPVSMTYASVPALRHNPDLAEAWVPKVLASRYDPALRPLADKAGVMIGMAMTEKQGGSDLRANTTRAEPDGNGGYRLTGHKWFCSAPMSDAFLTVAQAPGGLSCFLVPRIAPDGSRNAIQLMRLKDKLGNRSNASAEIEYHGAHAVLVGAEGRGVPTIIDMVHHTRLDTMASTLGIMRRALIEAVHHARHRHAFGRALIEQPAMRNVLADLQLDYEAAVVLTCRVARAFDGEEDSERSFARLAVALGKYWLTKRAAGYVMECMECLGGAGFIEDGPLPRLYREAPVNAIWEGSGNVIALDILRTLARAPQARDAYLAEIAPALGQNPALAAAAARLETDVAAAIADEGQARRLAGHLATVLCGSLLVRHAPSAVADAYCATRLGSGGRSGYGTLPAACDLTAILARSLAA